MTDLPVVCACVPDEFSSWLLLFFFYQVCVRLLAVQNTSDGDSQHSSPQSGKQSGRSQRGTSSAMSFYTKIICPCTTWQAQYKTYSTDAT
jgi:hypothetical protein